MRYGALMGRSDFQERHGHCHQERSAPLLKRMKGPFPGHILGLFFAG